MVPLPFVTPFALCQQGWHDSHQLNMGFGFSVSGMGLTWPSSTHQALMTNIRPLQNSITISLKFYRHSQQISQAFNLTSCCIYYTWKFFWTQILFKSEFRSVFRGTSPPLAIFPQNRPMFGAAVALLLPHELTRPQSQPHHQVIGRNWTLDYEKLIYWLSNIWFPLLRIWTKKQNDLWYVVLGSNTKSLWGAKPELGQWQVRVACTLRLWEIDCKIWVSRGSWLTENKIKQTNREMRDERPKRSRKRKKREERIYLILTL